MKDRFCSRFLSLLITFILILTMVPLSVLADTDEPTWDLDTYYKSINIHGKVNLDDFNDFNDIDGIDRNYSIHVDTNCEITGGSTSRWVYNDGLISDGVFNDHFINGRGATIEGGTFQYTVTNYGNIKDGVFNGTFSNARVSAGDHPIIYGGTFNGSLTNKWIINGGTFNGKVTGNLYLESTINGGVFNNEVTQINCVINGGTFNSTLNVSGEVNGGTINGSLTGDFSDSLVSDAVKFPVTSRPSPAEYGYVTNPSGLYSHGEKVEMTAVANDGYEFVKWVENGIDYSANSTIMIDVDYSSRTLLAVFEEKLYNIEVQTDGNGTATSTHSEAYANDVVSLSCEPSKGYVFKEWQVISGDVSVVDDSFTMPTDDVVIKAIFEKAIYSIDVYANDSQYGTAGASASQASIGDSITLAATPNLGYEFDDWYVDYGDVTIVDDEFIVDDSNVRIRASFVPVNSKIVITDNGYGTVSAYYENEPINDGSAEYNSVVNLLVTPNDEYYLSGWEIVTDNVTIDEDTNSFIMTYEDVEIKAIFEHDHQWTDWESNENSHWMNCTSACNITNVEDKEGFGEHEFDDEFDSTCNICGYEREVEYLMIEGETLEIEQGEEALFVSNADFDKFIMFTINGQKVDETNFEAVSGSTRITLKSSFTDLLDPGEYDIKIVSGDGVATAVLVVKAKTIEQPVVVDIEPVNEPVDEPVDEPVVVDPVVTVAPAPVTPVVETPNVVENKADVKAETVGAAKTGEDAYKFFAISLMIVALIAISGAEAFKAVSRYKSRR